MATPSNAYMNTLTSETFIYTGVFSIQTAAKICLTCKKNKMPSTNIKQNICLIKLSLLFKPHLFRIHYLAAYGYFKKILQKNCREIFPTPTYKKEVRDNSNFLFRFNYKSLSRQNSKQAVTIDRRFCAISKGNSTLIRRNRNSKQVPICYPFRGFRYSWCL